MVRCSCGSSGMSAASSDRRPAGPRQDVQDLQRRDDAVAAGGVLADDDVAALLAAEAGAREEHRVEDVAVAHVVSHHAATGRLDDRGQAAVGEDADDDGLLGKRAAVEPIEGDDAQQLVAIDDRAALIDGDAAVGVAIEAEADVRPPRAATMAPARRGPWRHSRG